MLLITDKLYFLLKNIIFKIIFNIDNETEKNT